MITLIFSLMIALIALITLITHYVDFPDAMESKLNIYLKDLEELYKYTQIRQIVKPLLMLNLSDLSSSSRSSSSSQSIKRSSSRSLGSNPTIIAIPNFPPELASLVCEYLPEPLDVYLGLSSGPARRFTGEEVKYISRECNGHGESRSRDGAHEDVNIRTYLNILKGSEYEYERQVRNNFKNAKITNTKTKKIKWD